MTIKKNQKKAIPSTIGSIRGSSSSSLDKFDIHILKILQKNSEVSMNELGEHVGLSHTPCWRRIKKLEEEGFIKQRVTLLAPKPLNLTVNVHAYITIKSHDESSLLAFECAVQDIPDIVECYSITGDKDYMLRIVAEDVNSYEKLLKNKLVHLPNVASVNSIFALKQVKYTTELPL